MKNKTITDNKTLDDIMEGKEQDRRGILSMFTVGDLDNVETFLSIQNLLTRLDNEQRAN